MTHYIPKQVERFPGFTWVRGAICVIRIEGGDGLKRVWLEDDERSEGSLKCWLVCRTCCLEIIVKLLVDVRIMRNRFYER